VPVEKPFKQRGGGQIGNFEATWPFATIAVEPGRLTLKILTSTISLTAAEVVAVEPVGFIPLWHGVNIHHIQNKVPICETFYSFDRNALLDAIAAAGFHIGKPPSPWGKPRKLG
jgi:hypothetical protein